AEPAETYAFMVDVIAEGRFRFSAILDWLNGHIKTLSLLGCPSQHSTLGEREPLLTSDAILLGEGGMPIRSLWAPPMLLPGNASNPASKLAIRRIPVCYNHHQGMRICESQSRTGFEVVGANFDDLPLRPTLKFNEHVERTRRYCFWSRGRLKQLMCGCRGLCELSSRKLLDS